VSFIKLRGKMKLSAPIHKYDVILWSAKFRHDGDKGISFDATDNCQTFAGIATGDRMAGKRAYRGKRSGKEVQAQLVEPR
jgi:hypothetical protein